MKKLTFKNQYNVQLSFTPSVDSNDTIIYYYQPLIGLGATSLYQFLLVEGKNNFIDNTFLSLERIASILDMNEAEINYALLKLEMLGLTSLFISSEDETKITINCSRPLTSKKFEENDQLFNTLKEKLSVENSIINQKFLSKNRRVVSKTNGWVKTSLKPEDVKLDVSEIFEFNFDKLKPFLDKKEVPMKNLKTKKISMLLQKTILMGEKDLYDIVNVIVRLHKQNDLNFESLDAKLTTKKVSVVDINALSKIDNVWMKQKMVFKQLSVEDFMKLRLDREITPSETSLALLLRSQFSIKEEIVNILFDYSLMKNNYVVVANYIIKIAETLNEKNINTLDGVKNHLKKSIPKQTNRILNSKKVVDQSTKEMFFDNIDEALKDIKI